MRKSTMAAAALIALTPLAPMSIAWAQDTNEEQTAREDDRDFPWGLLGLLGLAGLLGRKRNDRDDHVRRTDTGGNTAR